MAEVQVEYLSDDAKTVFSLPCGNDRSIEKLGRMIHGSSLRLACKLDLLGNEGLCGIYNGTVVSVPPPLRLTRFVAGLDLVSWFSCNNSAFSFSS